MSLAKPLAAASLVLGLLSATLTLAAENITLNAANIGVSPVLAWSWGASNTGSTHVGGGDRSVHRESDASGWRGDDHA